MANTKWHLWKRPSAKWHCTSNGNQIFTRASRKINDVKCNLYCDSRANRTQSQRARSIVTSMGRRGRRGRRGRLDVHCRLPTGV